MDSSIISYRTRDEFGNINYYYHDVYELLKITLVDNTFQEVSFIIDFRIDVDACTLTINAVNYTDDSDEHCDALKPGTSIEHCIVSFLYRLFNEQWCIIWHPNYLLNLNLDVVNLLENDIQAANFKNMQHIFTMDTLIKI